MREDIRILVERMIQVRASRSPTLSPDGKQVAYTYDFNGVPQIWKVSTEGGEPDQVTDLEDAIGSILWSPKGDWLAFTLAPGGGMNVQVYVIRPDGADIKRLTDGGKETNRLWFWTHDGNYLVIGSNRRKSEDIDAYFCNPDTGELRLVFENKGSGGLTDISRDGLIGVYNRLLHRGDNNLYLVNLENGSEELLTPHEGLGTFRGGLFSPDGKTVYLSSNKDRELLAFAKVELTDGHPGAIEILAERDDAELQTFKISPDGNTAALIWNAAGRSELSLLDLSTIEPLQAPSSPGEIVAKIEYSKDGRMLVINALGSTSPWDIWKLENGEMKKITHSAHLGVDLEKLTKPKLVYFKAHDGLELSGWLYVPERFSQPGPIVISYHGGPEGQERPRFNSTYQTLLASGIAIFAPNVRGSSGFGKTYVNLDNGALRFNGIKDIASCVDYVTESNIAAPKRIGIMGGSYGGYMTIAGLAYYPELFAAGANLYGVVNFETFFAHTEPWMAAISKVEYGDPDKEVELLRSLSPIHDVDKVKAPTIVLHGANDTNVPVIEAEQIVENLKQRGIPHEYILFPDEGHGFRKAKNRVTATTAITRWFQQYLQ